MPARVNCDKLRFLRKVIVPGICPAISTENAVVSDKSHWHVQPCQQLLLATSCWQCRLARDTALRPSAAELCGGEGGSRPPCVWDLPGPGAEAARVGKQHCPRLARGSPVLLLHCLPAAEGKQGRSALLPTHARGCFPCFSMESRS